MDDLVAVVGLGNPGRRYQATRHNAGFLVVGRLAERSGIGLDAQKFSAVIGKGRAAGRKVLLALPQTFMNRSGEAVARLLGFFRLGPDSLIVVHDDVDLEWGRLKIKRGGGTGGHRGLESIVAGIGSSEFIRVRIGVGRPDAVEVDTADWVLSRFTPAEMDALPGIMDDAAQAVEAVLAEGIDVAMNRFNIRS